MSLCTSCNTLPGRYLGPVGELLCSACCRRAEEAFAQATRHEPPAPPCTSPVKMHEQPPAPPCTDAVLEQYPTREMLAEQLRASRALVASLSAKLDDATRSIDTLENALADVSRDHGAAKKQIATLTEAHAKACFERDAARDDRDEARARWAELDARMAQQQPELQPPPGFTVEEQSVSFMARDGNLDDRVLWALREEGHTHGYFNTRGQAIEAACAIVEGRKP